MSGGGGGVVIVGGGVMGLSVAWRLAVEGVNATLLERREGVGREASWAGAGIIAANVDRLRTNPGVDLRSWSAALYPEWSAALREETGIDNGYRRCGGVDVARTPAEDDDLRTSAGRWRSERIVFERLDPRDFQKVEPALGPGLVSAYFLPDRAQVRNPRHLDALRAAAAKRGVTFETGREATGFDRRDGRVTAVRTADGPIACDRLVVTAGPWTGALLGGLGVDAPTPPLKGQIVLLKVREGDRSPRRVVEHGKCYLVPRDDGRVLVGATEEDAGFDTLPHGAGFAALLAEAYSLCPSLAEAEVERTWAGLRPGSLDTRPYIGRLPGYDNVVVAAGHKRAGLQLSPATAEAVVDLVLDRPPRIDLAPFRPGREPSPADPSAEAFRS